MPTAHDSALKNPEIQSQLRGNDAYAEGWDRIFNSCGQEIGRARPVNEMTIPPPPTMPSDLRSAATGPVFTAGKPAGWMNGPTVELCGYVITLTQEAESRWCAEIDLDPGKAVSFGHTQHEAIVGALFVVGRWRLDAQRAEDVATGPDFEALYLASVKEREKLEQELLRVNAELTAVLVREKHAHADDCIEAVIANDLASGD